MLMASRRLILDVSETRRDEKATYRLDPSGPVDEGDIERELLPLLYKYHPALDDVSGKLKQEPGVRDALALGPEFFLSAPDEEAISRFGGVRLPVATRDAFVRDLRASGWVIEE